MSEENVPSTPAEVPVLATTIEKAMEAPLEPALTAPIAEVAEGLAAAEAAPTEPAAAWCGEIINRLNITETLPVLEDEVIKNLGSLALSNFEAAELEIIRRGIYGRVFAAQVTRRGIVKSGAKHPFVPVDVDNKTVFLTGEELDAVNNVSSYTASLRVGFGFKLFEEDEWNNLPTCGEQRIAISQANAASSTDPIQRIRGKLGLATEANIPMWHSGLHFTIQGPGVLEQLRLETKLLDEKITMARDSSGLVYSASSVYLNTAVANFILGCVTKTNVGITNPEELKKLLLITDLEPLALGAASTIFPEGYNLDRPCLTTFGGCGRVETRKVNLRRMVFVRRSRINDSQFSLMAKRFSRVDVQTVQAYQQSIRPEVSRSVDIGNGFKLILRVPTFADYERQATAWMDQMDNRARVVMASYANETDRQTYLMRANNIAMVMAHSSWIEAVSEVGPTPESDDIIILSRNLTGDQAGDLEAQYVADEKLDQLLESFADDGELTQKISEGIEIFINAMTLATVAVPKSKCPGCGLPLTGDSLSKHPHLVSVNPFEVFFTLIHHKIKQAGG